jgi:hypothetical protein
MCHQRTEDPTFLSIYGLPSVASGEIVSHSIATTDFIELNVKIANTKQMFRYQASATLHQRALFRLISMQFEHRSLTDPHCNTVFAERATTPTTRQSWKEGLRLLL